MQHCFAETRHGYVRLTKNAPPAVPDDTEVKEFDIPDGTYGAVYTGMTSVFHEKHSVNLVYFADTLDELRKIQLTKIPEAEEEFKRKFSNIKIEGKPNIKRYEWYLRIQDS